ncbi:MAG: glutaredoxin family protein [Candidatus Sungbacteria bacterium]|nr:glutaredoxin family protein [bacterium]MDZ4285602.1 glutaredoxin family protein [Candidatus Sungbacteria bacterium]
MAHVIIYTTPSCVYCKKAKAFFHDHGVVYEEKDVSANSGAVDEMMEKSGQMGVPVIDVDGAIIVGFDEAMLKQALGI